jgi:transglutaminase-like putative cysteine protease
MSPHLRTIAIASAIAVGSTWPAPASAARWEPVPPEQLVLDRPRVEPAEAEAIFWKVWVQDDLEATGFVSRRDHYLRIKLFSAEAAQKFATIAITYPSRGATVSDVAARTILPDGRVIEVSPKTVVSEVALKLGRERQMKTSFAMPGLVPGAIIEYRYEERLRERATHYEGLDFQREIPIQRVVYYLKPLRGLTMRRMNFNVALAEATDEPGYIGVEAVNQRAFVEEPFMPPELRARGWMMLYYEAGAAPSAAEYWLRVGRELDATYTDDTKPDAAMRAHAEALVAGATTASDRARRLIEWVRREYRIVPQDSLKALGLREAPNVRTAWAQRAGTRHDANRVFAALARAADLEHRFARVPSHLGPAFTPDLANVWLAPHLRLAVKLEDGWRCLDAGTPRLPWDLLDWDQEGQWALACSHDSSRFFETAIAGPERSVLGRSAVLALDEGGALHGDMLWTATGHLGAALRQRLDAEKDVPADTVLRRFEAARLDGGIEIADARVDRGTAEHEPVSVRCRVTIPDFASVTGKRLLIPLGAWHARAAPRFPASRRRHAVHFPHAWSEQDTIRVRIPAGWKVEHVETPEPIVAEGVAEYRVTVAVKDDGSELFVRRSFDLGRGGSLAFAVRHYPALKQFFDGVHERDQATLTMVRAESEP